MQCAEHKSNRVDQPRSQVQGKKFACKTAPTTKYKARYHRKLVPTAPEPAAFPASVPPPRATNPAVHQCRGGHAAAKNLVATCTFMHRAQNTPRNAHCTTRDEAPLRSNGGDAGPGNLGDPKNASMSLQGHARRDAHRRPPLPPAPRSSPTVSPVTGDPCTWAEKKRAVPNAVKASVGAASKKLGICFHS